MASQGRQPFESRNGSTSSDAGSWASKDTVRDNQNSYRSNTDPTTSNGRNASPFPGNAKMDKYGLSLSSPFLLVIAAVFARRYGSYFLIWP